MPSNKDRKRDILRDVNQLAHHLYEGTPLLANLAEELARANGKAEAVAPFMCMDDDVQNFWRSIASQLIHHSSHWLPNKGCACVLDEEEMQRLKDLPRYGVPEEDVR